MSTVATYASERMRTLQSWVQRKAGVLALAATVVTLLFCLYLFTNADQLSAQSLDHYPFGADVPIYAFGSGVPNLHWLMTVVLKCYRAATSLLGLPETATVIKFPYALIGAANVSFAIAAFSVFFKNFSTRTVLYGACYGVTFIVWFYGSSPESYALTTLLYTIYLCAFLLATMAERPSIAHGVAMAGAFFAALYNDVSIVVLLIVPIIFWGKRLLREPGLTRIAILHGVAIALYLLHQVVAYDFIGKYVDFFFEYSPVDASGALAAAKYELAWPEPISSFFFYSLGAPAAELTQAPWLEFPHYRGFFEPSLFSYFGSAAGVLFLASCVALLSFVRMSKFTRLVVALLVFITIRFFLVLAFNPVEAILYASVTMLALLLMIFHFLEASAFRRKTAITCAFFVCLVAANGNFFL